MLPNFFVGAGASFEIRKQIEERSTAANPLTPYQIYNERYGFAADRYASNGLLLSAAYTTRG